jgi:uncharacterized membrane-anchored protein YjiN (DUF445 family)
MKESAKEKQIKIYKKMSAEKKIDILDDFYRFAKELKKDVNNDHKTVSRQNSSNARRT